MNETVGKLFVGVGVFIWGTIGIIVALATRQPVAAISSLFICLIGLFFLYEASIRVAYWIKR